MNSSRLIILLLFTSSYAYFKQGFGQGPHAEAQGFSETYLSPTLQAYSSGQDSLVMIIASYGGVCMCQLSAEIIQWQIFCYEGLYLCEGREISPFIISQSSFTAVESGPHAPDFTIFSPISSFSSSNSGMQDKKYGCSFYSYYSSYQAARFISSLSSKLCYYQASTHSSSHTRALGSYEAKLSSYRSCDLGLYRIKLSQVCSSPLVEYEYTLYSSTSYSLSYYKAFHPSSSPSSSLGYYESRFMVYYEDTLYIDYHYTILGLYKGTMSSSSLSISLYFSNKSLWTSFFEMPSNSQSYTDSTEDTTLYIYIIQPVSNIQIDLEEFYPTNPFTCRSSSLSGSEVPCNYDISSNKLSVSDLYASSSFFLIIKSLTYPSIPGLYNLPIKLIGESSNYYSYTTIIVMPSTAPQTLAIKLAHNAKAQYNIMTTTLKPSSGSFTKGDTVSIYFPAETPSYSDNDYSLGLCTQYNIGTYTLTCDTDSDINNYDEIPAWIKLTPV